MKHLEFFELNSNVSARETETDAAFILNSLKYLTGLLKLLILDYQEIENN